MRLTQIIRDDRGVALPMAMIVLVLLTTLMMAFALLAQTEPVIAHNQNRAAQARAQAEAGFERALWALTQGVIPPPEGGAAGSLPSPLPNPTGLVPVTAPAPYDGSTFIQNGSSGGFVVTVTTPDPVLLPNQRHITSTGWIPTNAAADTRTKSHRRIEALVERLPDLRTDPDCTACVRGDLQVGGTSNIDGTLDPCGIKAGAVASGSVAITSSSATIKGDDNGVNNQVGSDYVQYKDPDYFNKFTFTAQNLKLLRALAKENGTYFGPGYPNGTPAGSPTWTGSVTFNASHKLKSGMVFIDTVSGNDIPKNLADQNPADFANVDIFGNPFVDGDFQGWIVVNGSLHISGDMKIKGVVYAVNDFSYNGFGNGEIRGIAISQNIRDTTATAVTSSDSSATGNSTITRDCTYLDLPQGPRGYTLNKGTYRELSD
jgi:hypothetical protein